MTSSPPKIVLETTDAYTWSDQYGGSWGTAANWIDTNTGTVAAAAPAVTNTVTILGGPGNFTNIIGTGAAAQLTVGGDVLLWGTVTVAAALTVAEPAATTGPTVADLELDGAASLSAGSLNVGPGASLEVGGGSSLQVSGLTSLNGGFLGATNGSVVQLGALIANYATGSASNGYQYGSSTIGVDDNASLEVGTTGGAALGAVTIDAGQFAAISGAVDGNLVVNGTLGVQAGATLFIDEPDPFGTASKISGSGTLVLSENSTLALGVADSAAIRFAGPGGVLELGAITSGTISGFGAGDVIQTGTLATGLSFKQTTSNLATLTLSKGGKAVGTLTLAGNYSGSLFHISVNPYGQGSITLQTIGSAPVQPSLILGTPGYDKLTATANNQTLAGLGGDDGLSGSTFTGIDFKDTSADLSGSTISGFAVSDVIDLTDIKLASVSFTDTPGSAQTVYPYTVTPTVLSATDGTHAAAIDVSFNGTAPTGFFAASTDGSGGTDLRFTVVNLSATANNQTLSGLGAFIGKNDDLAGNGWTGIDFKDASTSLTGSTISGFVVSDEIDLIDMKLPTVSLTYTPGSTSPVYPYTVTPALLTVADGTHTAAIDLLVASALPTGYFSATSDGAAGTGLKYILVNTDAYAFASPLGGAFATAANWQDTTTAATATQPPGYGNAVTIKGGAATYSDITGNGAAASLATSSDVMLLGTLSVGSKVSGVSGALTQTGTLALDGAAAVTLAGEASVGGLLQLGGASRLTGAGGLSFAAAGATLSVFGGSQAQFAGVYGTTSLFYGTQFNTSVIGIDATSAIEFGTSGNAAKGALTIDSGVVADLLGTIEGNVVVNGTLAVTGSLAVGSYGTTLPAIAGTGTIDLSSGASLSLAGSDSATILFNQASPGSNISPTGTLALAGTLPTGTISGFAQGDLITVAKAVTSLTYAQNGNKGTLTLFDDSTKVGTLSFAGTYAPGQFQVELAHEGQSTGGSGGGSSGGSSGQSSTIFYTPAPSTTPGNQVSNNSDNYSWTNTSGGLWSSAGNWADRTTGTTPPTAPGAGNEVIVQGGSGSSDTAQIISGSGAAASLNVEAATVFTGAMLIAGQFILDGYANSPVATELTNAATFSAGSLYDYSTFGVTGGSSLAVNGSSNSYSYIQGDLSVAGGSTVRMTGSNAPDLYGMISVDSTSSFEVGAAGTPAAGALTIDNGQSLSQIGGTIAATLVVNGLLATQGGLIEGDGGAVGSISGTGTIDINAGQLTLDAKDTAQITFSSYGSQVLELRGPLPTGTISGFGAHAAIQVDQPVTGVSFKQTTATQGTLTLTNGATTVGTLALSGNYAASLFHVDVAATTGYATISAQTAPTAAGTATASTGKDAYRWTGASGGSWSTATNWSDTTTGSTPATVPGSGDAVTISGSIINSGSSIATGGAGSTVVGGTGAAASLSTSGDVLLTGTVAVAGQLAITAGSGLAELALDPKAKLTAGAAAITGALQAGGGSSATISGTATLVGGSLLALDGSTVQVGALIGNNSSNVIAVDASSIIKIGAPTAAVAGAVTQQAGATAAFTGAIYGSVVAGGTLAVAGGGALFIDMNGIAASDPYSTTPTISGAGTLSITEGSTLGLGATDTTAIQFAGPNGTLALARLPAATISGFATGDQIQVDQGVTALSYQQVTATTGTLTLTNGAATVGTLALAGSYGNGTAFHLGAATNGATAVITLQSLGIAAAQPALIQGTAAADLLSATANGQVITGSGGGDTLNGGSFTGLDFKDLTAALNGSAIQNFAPSDVIDFTDMKLATAAANYAAGVLSVSDGTHSATLGLGFASPPAGGSFTVATDGAAGTKVAWS
jgi:hypothetical protein